MRENSRRQDYHEYRWKKGEGLRTAALCAGAVVFLACFFYRSLWACIPLAPLGWVCFRMLQKKKKKRTGEILAEQFRECILSVSSSLQAGYSAENAFLECGEDMRLLYGEKALICQELGFIRRGLQLNISLEELLRDFAERSDCPEIEQFAQIFSLAKRNGGNMAAVIKSSATLIGKRIEIRRELQTLLAGKRMELNIMKGMPFAILLYVSFGTPGYFDALYHNLTGAAIMTACLAVYLGAFLLGEAVLGRMTAEVSAQ